MPILRMFAMALMLSLFLLCGCGDGNANNTQNETQQPLFITPPDATVAPGQTATYTLTAQSATPLTSPINLTLTGLPEQTTIVFDPPQIAPGDGTGNRTTTLQITPAASIPDGIYNFTVLGTVDGAQFGQAVATLTVRTASNGPQGFSLSVSPASATVSNSIPASFNVAVTPNGGFTDSVTVSVSGGSGDILVSSPTPTTLNFAGGGTATTTFGVSLNPSAISSLPVTLTVTATGGGVTQTTSVVVQPQPQNQ